MRSYRDDTVVTCGGFWAVLKGTNNTVYICGDTTATLTGLGPFATLQSDVPNRIRFHQNADNSSWTDCCQGQGKTWNLASTSARDENAGNIQVSANTAAC